MLNVVVVGLMNPMYNAHHIAESLKDMGINVLKIAIDRTRPEKTGDFDIHIYDEYEKESCVAEKYFLDVNQRRLFIRNYINNCGPIDFILVIQGHELSISLSGIQVPIFYYHTEILIRSIPEGGNINGLFYGFNGADDVIKNSHLYQYSRLYFRKFLPYAIQPDIFEKDHIIINERPIKFGFMGKLYMKEHCSKEYMDQHIYDLRREYVEYAQANLGLNVRGPMHMEDYITHLEECQLCLNVPGIAGDVNQRQFEVLAAGGILVQYYYKGLEEMGYIDKVNCLFFHDKESLKKCVEWFFKQPVEIQLAMQKESIELAFKHTYYERTKTILETISHYDQRQIEVMCNIEFGNDMEKLFEPAHDQLAPDYIKERVRSVGRGYWDNNEKNNIPSMHLRALQYLSMADKIRDVLSNVD